MRLQIHTQPVGGVCQQMHTGGSIEGAAPGMRAPVQILRLDQFNNVTAAADSGLSDSGKVVVTAKGAHPRGSWLLSGSTVYFVTPDGLIPVPTWDIFLGNGGQGNFLVKANSYDTALVKLGIMTADDVRLK